MNHTVYRHLSMPCPAMRDGLRLMLEGSGKFEVAGHARDGEAAVVVWLCGMDCFGDSPRVRTSAQQLRRKLSDDADHHAYTFIEPRVGYRMEKGDGTGAS